MNKEVLIKIEGEEWKEALEKALKKVSKNAELDGFRLGKAPKDVVKKRCADLIFEEAIDLVLESAYTKLVDVTNDLIIVAKPEVSLNYVDENYAEFKFDIILPPEVKLGKYTNLGIKRKEVKVTKKEVEEHIEELRNRCVDFVEKDIVEEEDDLVVEIHAFENNKRIEELEDEDYWFTVGYDDEYPGLNEAVIGMKKDEEKQFDVTFPEDYFDDELIGKTIKLKIKIKAITREKLPELNQKFYEDLGLEDINTKEEFEELIETMIKEHKQMQIEEEYFDKIIEKVIKNSKFEIPEAMIETKINEMIEIYGLDFDDDSYEEFIEFHGDDIRKDLRPQAIKLCELLIIIGAVIEKENITATEKEIEEEFDRIVFENEVSRLEVEEEFATEDIANKIKMRKAIEIMKG